MRSPWSNPAENLVSSALSGQKQVSAMGSPKRAWRRVLWEERDAAYEDDYVDEATFLKDLKMNALLDSPSYASLVRHSSAIAQQIALVAVYLLAFHAALHGRVDPFALYAVCAAGCAVLCAAPAGRPVVPVEALTTSAWLFFVSPVVRSLTLPWADDTMETMCVLLFLVHLAAADYSPKLGGEEPVATNAASFATVVLSSRLQSPALGFGMMALSVVLFTLSPQPRKQLRGAAPNAWLAGTWLLVGGSTAQLAFVAPALAAGYAATVFGVTFAIPALFRYLQCSAKLQISGPWDEARPKNSLAALEWAKSC